MKVHKLLFVLILYLVTLTSLSASGVYALITDDFKIIDTMNYSSKGLSATSGGIIEPYNVSIDNDGSYTLYSNESNLNSWIYLVKTLDQPIDFTNKIFYVWIYINQSAISKVSEIRIKLCDENIVCTEYPIKTYIGYKDIGGWQVWWISTKVYGFRNGTLDITKIKYIYIGIETPSSIRKGEVLIDRMFYGTGLYVTFSSQNNPTTIYDLYMYSERKYLGIVQKDKDGYILNGKIIIGDGVNPAYLLIRNKNLYIYSGGLSQGEANFILNDYTTLEIDNSVIYQTRNVWWQGSILQDKSTSEIIIKNSGIYSTLTGRNSISSRTILENVTLKNIGLWFFTDDISFNGYIMLLGSSWIVFDKIAGNCIIDNAVIQLHDTSRISPRQCITSIYNVYFYDGSKYVPSASLTSYRLYNPYFLNPENDLDGTVTSTTLVYYNVTLLLRTPDGDVLNNVDLKIYYSNGTLAKEFVNASDIINTQVLVYKLITNSSGQYYEDYNPFKIEIIKDGEIIGITYIEIRNPFTKYHIIPKQFYYIVTWSDKDKYYTNEVVRLFAEIKGINNNVVEVNDIFGVVIDPIGIKTNISFIKMDNIYIAEFNNTSNRGKYAVEIYVKIENTTINDVMYFDVYPPPTKLFINSKPLEYGYGEPIYLMIQLLDEYDRPIENANISFTIEDLYKNTILSGYMIHSRDGVYVYEYEGFLNPGTYFVIYNINVNNNSFVRVDALRIRYEDFFANMKNVSTIILSHKDLTAYMIILLIFVILITLYARGEHIGFFILGTLIWMTHIVYMSFAATTQFDKTLLSLEAIVGAVILLLAMYQRLRW